MDNMTRSRPKGLLVPVIRAVAEVAFIRAPETGLAEFHRVGLGADAFGAMHSTVRRQTLFAVPMTGLAMPGIGEKQ